MSNPNFYLGTQSVYGVGVYKNGGTDTSDATATAADIVAPKTAYIINGEKVTGINPYEKIATDTEISTQATKIAEISTILTEKGSSTTNIIDTTSSSQLAQNTINLNTLIEQVNALSSVVVYSGSGEPIASLGKDGDIFFITRE